MPYLHRFYILLLAFVTFSTIFHLYPEIDLSITSLIYNNKDGFYLRKIPFISWLNDIIIYIPYSVIFFTFLLKIVKAKDWRGIMKIFTSFSITMILLTLIIYSSHNIAKNMFHRPRPEHLIQFQGIMEFAPALQIDGQCYNDCSFFSSHTVAGYAIAVLGMIEYGWGMYSFMLGTFMGIVRIIYGKHFFSDIIFAGIFTYTIILLMEICIKNKIKLNKGHSK